MNSRIVLLSIAVVVIGLFAMPTTLSLFSGQHTFKDANETASDDSCRKCHEDVYEELHSAVNTVHWNNPNDANDRFQCRECHNVTNVSTYFQTGSTVRSEAHAATTVSCLACHSGLKGYSGSKGACDSCHAQFSTNVPGPEQFPMHALAFKYGKTHNPNSCGQCHLDEANPTKDNVFIDLVNKSIIGSDATHTDFYYQSKYPDNQTDIALKDANTACIGCHTHSGINVTWVRLVGYNMDADLTTGNWNMSLSLNQTTTNTTSAGN